VAHPQISPAFEDLTARARIRDAALRLFADRGIDGATIRDIAKEAGVSAGLVRHHFGSKDELRDACDQYALERLLEIKMRAFAYGDDHVDLSFLPAAHPTVLMLMRYFARSMVDGSEAAARIFDQMVELTEAWLIEHRPGVYDDPRAFAAVLVAMQMGPIMLHDHVSRALGADIMSPAGQPRMGKAMVDLHAHALITPDVADQAREAYDQVRDRQPRVPQPSTTTGRADAVKAAKAEPAVKGA